MNENMDFVSIKKVTQKQTDMTVYLVMDQKGYDNWMGMMEVSAGLTPEIVARGWMRTTASRYSARARPLKRRRRKRESMPRS